MSEKELKEFRAILKKQQNEVKSSKEAAFPTPNSRLVQFQRSIKKNEGLNVLFKKAGLLVGSHGCKDEQLSFEEIREMRAQKAVPVLDALGKWMKEQYMQVTPKSAIGKALAYSIERWKRLSLYTTNGMLNIDNNPVENSIRPVALGRKNYLFAGSHEAAQRSAMLYSLLGTCKMNGIEPFAWLRSTLNKIADHPLNRISELLPNNQGVQNVEGNAKM